MSFICQRKRIILRCCTSIFKRNLRPKVSQNQQIRCFSNNRINYEKYTHFGNENVSESVKAEKGNFFTILRSNLS